MTEALRALDNRLTTVVVVGRIDTENAKHPADEAPRKKRPGMVQPYVPLNKTLISSVELVGAKKYDRRSTYSHVLGESPQSLSIILQDQVFNDGRQCAIAQTMGDNVVYRVAVSEGMESILNTGGAAVETIRSIRPQDVELGTILQCGAQTGRCSESSDTHGSVTLIAWTDDKGTLLYHFRLSDRSGFLSEIKAYDQRGMCHFQRDYRYPDELGGILASMAETRFRRDGRGRPVMVSVSKVTLELVTPVAPEDILRIDVGKFLSDSRPGHVIDMRDGGREKPYKTLSLR